VKELNWIQLKEPCVSFLGKTHIVISFPKHTDLALVTTFIPLNFVSAIIESYSSEVETFEARFSRLETLHRHIYRYWFSPTGTLDDSAILIASETAHCDNKIRDAFIYRRFIQNLDITQHYRSFRPSGSFSSSSVLWELESGVGTPCAPMSVVNFLSLVL
jgi:hypothetical protein